MTDSHRPRIAVFSGATATIANTQPLVTSNKGRARYGLPLRTHPDGSTPRFDVLRPQRLARPVTVYVQQFSAHPLEADAADLYDGRLPEMRVRTLIVHGGRDPRTEPGELAALRAALPRADVAILEAGAHSPHSERAAADDVTRAVSEFLG